MSDPISIAVTLTTYPVTVEVATAAPGGGGDVAASIHAATAVSAPADADELGLTLSPSWLLRKLTFANLKAWIRAFLTGGGDALTPADIGAATTAQGDLADSALQAVPSLRVFDLAAQWCIDLSGVTTQGVNGRLINSDYVSGYTQWTSNGLSESVNIGNGAYTVLTRGGGRWNVRSYDDFNNKIYEAAYSATFAGTDPTAQPYDVISKGAGTPVLVKVPVTASFIGQPYLRGAVMPFEVWECTGQALTDFTRIENPSLYAAVSHSHASSLTDLGSGTPGATNFLRGDGTWQVVSGAPPILQFATAWT